MSQGGHVNSPSACPRWIPRGWGKQRLAALRSSFIGQVVYDSDVIACPLFNLQAAHRKQFPHPVHQVLGYHCPKTLQGIVHIEHLIDGLQDVFVACLVVLHSVLSLQCIGGTAGTASSAEGQQMPLIHCWFYCTHQIPPNEVEQWHVSRKKPHLVEHGFDITTDTVRLVKAEEEHNDLLHSLLFW